MEPSGVTVSHLRGARRLLVVAVLATACQAPAGSPSAPAPSTGPSSAPPSAPIPSPTPSAGTAGLFHVIGSAPVLARSRFAGRGAVLPAAITAAPDGTYHAWVIAFASTPGIQEPHHLTSPDAVAWTEVPDASLARLSIGLGNPGAMPTSVLATGSGWVMYYTGTLATEREGWGIWRATAPGPDGPWTPGGAPVLRRGPAGAWDSGGLDFPTVVPTDEGYSLFYSGNDPAHRERGALGLATSTDGVAWAKHDDPATADAARAESDPIVEPGLCGGFDDLAIHQPRVVSSPDGLVMAYAGYTGPLDSRASVGYADSLDGGLTWDCEWRGPALDTARLPDGFVHTVTAFQRGERVALLVEWFTDAGTDVWLADLGLTAGP